MELAYTMVLEAIAARIESSSLSGGTKSNAGVEKLVYSKDLKSFDFGHAGSTPASCTKEFKSQTVSWSETGWLHTEQEQLDLTQF